MPKASISVKLVLYSNLTITIGNLCWDTHGLLVSFKVLVPCQMGFLLTGVISS